MKTSIDISKNRLKEKGLKITPQRIAILDAVIKLNNHPTAEMIIDYIRQNHPNIATGTVYKVLEALVETKIINKVKSSQDIMRYDAELEKHHHLYSSTSERIEDYFDEELDNLIEEYFNKKGISDFKIEDIKLQIKGKFLRSERE